MSAGITYVKGCHTLRPPDTECKHLAFNAAVIDLEDRVCLPNSPGGGRSGISGQQSNAKSTVNSIDIHFNQHRASEYAVTIRGKRVVTTCWS